MEPSEAVTRLDSDTVETRRDAARTLFRGYRTLIRGSSVSTPQLYRSLRTACRDADPLVRGHALSPFTAITRRMNRHLDADDIEHERPPLQPVFDALLDSDERVFQTAIGVLQSHTPVEIVHTPVTDAEAMSVVAEGVFRGLQSDNDVIRRRATNVIDEDIASAHPEPETVVEVLVDYLVDEPTSDLPFTRRGPARALPDVAERHPQAVAPELDRISGALDDEDRRQLAARTLVSIATNSEHGVVPDLDVLTAGLSADDRMDRIEMADTLADLALSEPRQAGVVCDLLGGALLDPQGRARKRIGKAVARVVSTHSTACDSELQVLLQYSEEGQPGLTSDPIEILAANDPDYLLNLFAEAFDQGRTPAFHKWVIGPAIDIDPSIARGLVPFYRSYLESSNPEEVGIGFEGVKLLAGGIPEELAELVPTILTGLESSDYNVRWGLEAVLMVLKETTPTIDTYDPVVTYLRHPDKRLRNMAAEILVRMSLRQASVPPVAHALSEFVIEVGTDGTVNGRTTLEELAEQSVAEGGPESTAEADDEEQQTPLDDALRDDLWPLGVVANRTPEVAERAVAEIRADIDDASPLRLRESGKALAEIAHGQPSMIVESVDALAGVAIEDEDEDRREAANDAFETVETAVPEIDHEATESSQDP